MSENSLKNQSKGWDTRCPDLTPPHPLLGQRPKFIHFFFKVPLIKTSGLILYGMELRHYSSRLWIYLTEIDTIPGRVSSPFPRWINWSIRMNRRGSSLIKIWVIYWNSIPSILYLSTVWCESDDDDVTKSVTEVTHLNISAKWSQIFTKTSANENIGLPSWLKLFLGACVHGARKRARNL